MPRVKRGADERSEGARLRAKLDKGGVSKANTILWHE